MENHSSGESLMDYRELFSLSPSVKAQALILHPRCPHCTSCTSQSWCGGGDAMDHEQGSHKHKHGKYGDTHLVAWLHLVAFVFEVTFSVLSFLHNLIRLEWLENTMSLAWGVCVSVSVCGNGQWAYTHSSRELNDLLLYTMWREEAETEEAEGINHIIYWLK